MMPLNKAERQKGEQRMKKQVSAILAAGMAASLLLSLIHISEPTRH